MIDSRYWPLFFSFLQFSTIFTVFMSLLEFFDMVYRFTRVILVCLRADLYHGHCICMSFGAAGTLIWAWGIVLSWKDCSNPLIPAGL